MLAHGREGAAVIGLQPQEIVGPLGPNLCRDVRLAAHGVERHDGALEMQGVEQLGDGSDLVRLAVDLALAERQPLITPLRWYSSRCATGTLTSSAQALTRCSGP